MYVTSEHCIYVPNTAMAALQSIHQWLASLPPSPQWATPTTSVPICTSPSSPRISLQLYVTLHSSYVTFTIAAAFNAPISLWSSKPVQLKSGTQLQALDADSLASFFTDIVNCVINYGPSAKNGKPPPLLFRRPPAPVDGEVFDLAFFSLAFLVCIYESPRSFGLRDSCLDVVKARLTSPRCRGAARALVRMLGANLEDQWMRSMNLAVTNWMVEAKSLAGGGATLCTAPSSAMFSHSVSATGLWKVQLYCPVIAMGVTEDNSATADDRLMFSLLYQQLEAVVQLTYRTVVRESWVDVDVTVDNIRCDVSPLVAAPLMSERGYGAEEKHFPSRISLELTPTQQQRVLSVSLGRSSDNPAREVELEKAFEGAFDAPNAFGIHLSAAEHISLVTKPWKFEQSVHGSSASFHWFLHDGVNGREVYSSKPSKLALLQPKAWFRDRYATAHRPFTRDGGVVFARDEYGDGVCWKVCNDGSGGSMDWEVRGWVWLTYWPNKQRTFYSETRLAEFRECLHLPLPQY